MSQRNRMGKSLWPWERQWYFDRTQTAQTTKDKTDILDLTKSKTSAQQKKNFYGNLKPSHQLEENICNINFDKGPLKKHYICGTL